MPSTNVSRMSRNLMLLIVVLAALYLTLCGALYVFQRALIYYPQPRAIGTSETLLTLPVDDAQLQLLADTTRHAIEEATACA